MTNDQKDKEPFQQIFESSSRAIIVADCKGNITIANLAACHFFAFAKKEIIGTPLVTIIPEIDKAEESQGSVWVHKKDGSVAMVNIQIQNIEYDNIEAIIVYIDDVTEDLIYKWANKENQFNLSNTESQGSIGNWHWIFETDECYWSDEFYKICGLPPGDERLSATTAMSFIHPDDQKTAVEAVTKAIEDHTPYTIEKRIVQPNGKIRTVITSGKVDYNKHGQPSRMTGTMRDITPLKNEQRAVVESARKYNTLINNLRGIVYSCENNLDYTMKYISDGCNEITGYTSNDFLNGIVTYGDLILEEDRIYVWDAIQKALSRDEHYDISYRIEHNDGTIKYVREIGCGVLRGGSEPMLEGYISDVTNERIVKKELEESKEQLESYSRKLEEKVKVKTQEEIAATEQLVTSNLNLKDQIEETKIAEKEVVVIKSLSSAIAKSFPNGFVVVFNPDFKIELLQGESLDQLRLGTIIYEGMQVDEIPIFSEKEKESLKEQISKTLEGSHLSTETNFKKRFFSLNTTPLLNGDDIVNHALFVYTDITEQKNIERKIKNSLQQEKELNELKSRFISMASHEFRTPLSAILTSAILIAKQNETGKEEKRIKYVDQIKKNVKHLVVILNDFLSLSKLEEGKVIPKMELLNIIDFSKDLINEISITKKKGQHINFSYPESSLSLNLDPKLFRHIILNLLSNAIKYSAENAQIYFTIARSDYFVSLEIKDEGIGIPEDEQEKLFERFFRAKNAINFEGTGLGLNIVRQYVTLMDGTIQFKSTLNKGSTFIVSWPIPPLNKPN